MGIIISDKQNLVKNRCKEWYKNYHKSKPYHCIAGVAGSGKSTIITHIIEELNLNSNKVVTVAYTGMAACVLIKKGNKNSSTVHKLAYNSKIIVDKETNKKKFITELKTIEEMRAMELELIIVDEYSMLPNKMLLDLLTFGIPVLLVGDPGQIESITGMSIAVIDSFLDEPHRQALESPIIQLATYARLKQFDKIRIGDYGSDVIVYSKDNFPDTVLTDCNQIIACKNKTVDAINTVYRSEYLGYNNNLIMENEKIMCLQNNWGESNMDKFCLVNGLIGNATDISIKAKAQLYKLSFKPEFTDTFRDILVDKYLFEGNEIVPKKIELFRKPFTEAKSSGIEGMPMTMGDKINEFKYAYAITCHKSQGSEWDKVTFMPEMINRNNYHKLLYTGITRAKDSLNLII